MKRVAGIVLLILLFHFPSNCQIRIIEGNRATYDGSGGGPFNLGEEIFRYRVICGRYPNNKGELLDFLLDKRRLNSVDSVFVDYIIMQNKVLAKEINRRENKLTVSGDTCTFYIAKTECTIQCIGGVAELQKYDSEAFHFWAGSQCYDKKGKYLWQLEVESPYLPSAVEDLNTRFIYVVTTKPKRSEGYNNEVVMIGSPRMQPVFVQVTMTKNGVFSYDLSSLEGIQLYFQAFEEQLTPTNTTGPITIEEAFDPDYFSLIKDHMTEFMDEHNDVDCLKLWELILFNQRPNKPITEWN